MFTTAERHTPPVLQQQRPDSYGVDFLRYPVYLPALCQHGHCTTLPAIHLQAAPGHHHTKRSMPHAPRGSLHRKTAPAQVKYETHSADDGIAWPEGDQRREQVRGKEEKWWDASKFSWRSTGNVNHNESISGKAELRFCLGAFACNACGFLVRPHTKGYNSQSQASCSCGGSLVHHQCKAKVWRFVAERGGVEYSTWVHKGSHLSHPRPPGGRVVTSIPSKSIVASTDSDAPEIIIEPLPLSPTIPISPVVLPRSPPVTQPSHQVDQKDLISYSWSGGNSCFFDVGLALWFESFKRCDQQCRHAFLASLELDSVLSSIFTHFERRIKWLERDSGGLAEGRRELVSGQRAARRGIFDRLNLYESAGAYGCARTWLVSAVAVSLELFVTR